LIVFLPYQLKSVAQGGFKLLFQLGGSSKLGWITSVVICECNAFTRIHLYLHFDHLWVGHHDSQFFTKMGEFHTMKTIAAAVCMLCLGVYMLWQAVSEWITDRTMTIFVKGNRDIILSADDIWIGLLVNGSLILALILGAYSSVMLRFSNRDLGSFHAGCLFAAGFFFLNFILFYVITLMIFF